MSNLITAKQYTKLTSDLKRLLETKREQVEEIVARQLIEMYWLIGQRMGPDLVKQKADDGRPMLMQLADDIGLPYRTLCYCQSFYQQYPEAPPDSSLTWSHFRTLMSVKDDWSPKTNEREIPINDDLDALLKKQKKKYGDSRYVFPDENGGKIFRNRLRRRFMALTKQCGFPEITKIHTLRHTFASHLVMSGVDLATVKRLLGHSDIQTTMIYSHLADEHVDRAMDKVSF